MSKGRGTEDNYGRPFLNFRVSITQKCNLRCPYCHREGQPSSPIEMTPDEIAGISRIAAELGAHDVKLTGGEPLLRKDVTDIVRLLSDIKGIREVSLVTNGTLLTNLLAKRLRQNGLTRVNVNLPSIDEATYRRLTSGELQEALRGVRAATNAGLTPVKINMLLLKGENENHVDQMTKFAGSIGAVLQVIELEPLNVEDLYFREHHCTLELIEDRIAKAANKVELRPSMHARRVYTLGNVKVELVHPVENTEFCLHCSRVRLTSDGKIKPCLMTNDGVVDILSPLRSGKGEEELRRLFVDVVRHRRPFFGAWSKVYVDPQALKNDRM